MAVVCLPAVPLRADMRQHLLRYHLQAFHILNAEPLDDQRRLRHTPESGE